LSWRWVFYVNLPLGFVALAAIASRLHLPVKRTPHRVDYPGAVLLGISVVTLLLATVWGGVDYPWGSVQIIGLFVGSLVSALLFVWREARAREPILPLRLFRNEVFSVSVLLSLLVGVVMFGAIIFLPEYQQLVRGDSATKSGLMLLPLVMGVVCGSMGSGRLITKLGRYRRFPIIGTVLLIISFWLFSHLAIDTNRVILGAWMVVLGLGVGMVMPVLTLAVQNGVDRRDLGTATSSVTFFRSIGASLGTAFFGAILTNRLTYHLQQDLPHTVASKVASGLSHSTAGLESLPANQVHLILTAFAQSFADVFLIGVPFAIAAFVVTLFLKESPLSDTTRAIAEGEALEIHHTG
jgi:MFS family permease